MDMSKLPRLSNTPTPPPAPPQPTPAPGPDYPRTPSPLSGMAEAWLSFAIAAFLLFMFPNLLKYVTHPGTTQFDAGVYDANGNQTGTIPYLQSAFFKMDLGTTIFAAVLAIDGLVLLLPRRAWLLMAVLAVTVATALLNVWVVCTVYGLVGLAIPCALAVALSGYMALVQFAAWSEVRISRA
jgi:hypothetical protein